ncbi:MAG: ABC transporter ATP-binding protein [Pseudomonadota bacterium]
MTEAAAVDIVNVVKRFGEVAALRGASLAIRDNEFFTLLGPSGCGKTTLLRMIAGFEEVTSGEIFLYGEEIEDLPPDKRPVNTVFQNYALFPHMTVVENVAFGMKMLGRDPAEIALRTAEMLSLVKLDDYAARRPNQLSGGQQQRVALARALAPGPKVLLLDEPLSALDLKLRQAMRTELRRLQRETAITFVFVTHDQEEALTMSDRIAVMSDGEIQQVGRPEEIYEAPANRFVADFIGETNFLDAVVEAAEPAALRCTFAGAPIACAPAALDPGANVTLSVRPERLSLGPEGTGLPGAVDRLVYLGTDTQTVVKLDAGPELTVRTQNAQNGGPHARAGDRVGVVVEEGAARALAP